MSQNLRRPDPQQFMSGSPRERLQALAQSLGTELPLAEGALLIAAEAASSTAVRGGDA